jgi:hypothetical protein
METKQCLKCKEIKPILSFGKHKGRKDGLSESCFLCSKKIQIDYYTKFPWKRTLVLIKQRCNNSYDKSYKYYGARGIKCLITENELKLLWFKNKAYEMSFPSIGRKNHNKDYYLDNCQYIEKSFNTGESSKRNNSKPVFQFTLQGIFIQEWPSVHEASRKLKITNSNICECISGKHKQTHGFLFKYK